MHHKRFRRKCRCALSRPEGAVTWIRTRTGYSLAGGTGPTTAGRRRKTIAPGLDPPDLPTPHGPADCRWPELLFFFLFLFPFPLFFFFCSVFFSCGKFPAQQDAVRLSHRAASGRQQRGGGGRPVGRSFVRRLTKKPAATRALVDARSVGRRCRATCGGRLRGCAPSGMSVATKLPRCPASHGAWWPVQAGGAPPDEGVARSHPGVRPTPRSGKRPDGRRGAWRARYGRWRLGRWTRVDKTRRGFGGPRVRSGGTGCGPGDRQAGPARCRAAAPPSSGLVTALINEGALAPSPAKATLLVLDG